MEDGFKGSWGEKVVTNYDKPLLIKMLKILLENSNKLFPGPTLTNKKCWCDKVSVKQNTVCFSAETSKVPKIAIVYSKYFDFCLNTVIVFNFSKIL